MRAHLFALLLGLAAFGAVGCKDFTYFDIDVALDSSFNGTYGQIQTCHMSVSGVEAHDYVINDNRASCPPTGLSLGTYEYSSLADSGQLTFTMKVYRKVTEKPECLMGTGSVSASLPAPMVTNMVMMTVMGSGTGTPTSCP
jgi:hypothetical protein